MKGVCVCVLVGGGGVKEGKSQHAICWIVQRKVKIYNIAPDKAHYEYFSFFSLHITYLYVVD